MAKDARDAYRALNQSLLQIERFESEGKPEHVDAWKAVAVTFAGQVIEAGAQQDLAQLAPIALPENIGRGSKVGKAIRTMNAAIAAAGEPSTSKPGEPSTSKPGEPSTSKPRKIRKARKGKK